MKKHRNKGFTLVELMIALAVGGIVTTAVYTTYKSQQDSYVAQEEVAVMQQNLRAAMFYVEREVRLAGCNPTEIAGTGFTGATHASLSFTMDITGGASGGPDGDTDDPGETITYSLDAAHHYFRRNDGVSNETVAQNIEALNFVYFNSNINDGVDNDGDGLIDELDEGRMVTPLLPGDMGRVRAVQITLLARSDRADPKILNDEVYRNPMGDIIFGKDTDVDRRSDPPPDNFRRRMVTTTVKVRNLNIY